MDSLQRRKEKIFEEGCASCGIANSVGGDGYESSSDSSGPTSGYDPLMKTLKRIKKKRSERK